MPLKSVGRKVLRSHMVIYQEQDWRLAGLFKVIGAITLTGGCAIAFCENHALAQSNIVPDATLGAESSFVVPNFNGLPVEVIAGGTIQGANLFHSFSEFNVSEGRAAYFFSPTAAIETILARVTGSNRSQIFGVLGTFGNSQPNLFLINPNGILFGLNAQLDVGGSFIASTAESVVFDNGFAFSTTNPQAPPLLTITTPIGLQYGSNPGNIVNQSVVGLRVQPGRTLALVGGDVAIEGGILSVTDGRIELGSVAGNNRVNLAPTNTGYALDYENVQDFQDINLTQAAAVITDGQGSGSIQVQGRNVTLTEGSQIGVLALGSGGGEITVNASDSVQLIGTTPNGQINSGIATQMQGAGNAVDVTLTAGQLLLKDGAGISAITSGQGDGGSVIVEVSGLVQLIGTTPNGQINSGIATQTRGAGKAGDVRLTAEQLLIQNGAGIFASTFGQGDGGSLSVEVSDSMQLIGTAANGSPSSIAAQTQTVGKAGDVRLTAGQLLLKDGALVSARTLGEGDGGSVIVEVSDLVQLIGTNPYQSPSGITAQTLGAGNAGNVRLTAGQLLLKDGAGISASTFGQGDGGSVIVEVSDSIQLIGTTPNSQLGSGVFATTRGAGNAGNVRLTAGQLLLKDGAEISATTLGEGKGGSVTVAVSDSVQLIGTAPDGSPSAIATETGGAGKAGNVMLTAGQLLVRDGGAVSASTFGEGEGGSLSVEVSDSVQLIGTAPNGAPSRITAETGGASNAGDVRLTAGQLLISDGAGISASTLGAGEGGSVTVAVSDLVQLIGTTPDGLFGSGIASQTLGTGKAGDVSVTAGQLLISDGAGISTSTLGAGEGGSVIVEVSDSVQLIGTTPYGLGSGIASQTLGAGNAGDVSVTARQLLIQDGAGISASSLAEGEGGSVIVEVSDSVQLSGAGSIAVAAFAGGTAGDLTLTTRQLSVQDEAKVTVSSPLGQAGNLTITADSVLLNRGTISAETAKSGDVDGANITLQGLDLLRMDNESLISASALEDANGGNVTIDSTFIVATPPKGRQGSDIIANAIRGNGGRVNVTTQGLFGIDFRPQRTPDNDITVSSQSGLPGVYQQNRLTVDLRQGFPQLPSNLVDMSRQIDRRCTSGTAQRNSFIITGRGGLPPSPNDVLQNEEVITPWIALDSEEDSTNPSPPEANPTNSAPKQLVEAQSWIYGPNGEIILVAQAPTTTPYNSWQTSPSCDDLHSSAK